MHTSIKQSLINPTETNIDCNIVANKYLENTINSLPISLERYQNLMIDSNLFLNALSKIHVLHKFDLDPVPNNLDNQMRQLKRSSPAKLTWLSNLIHEAADISNQFVPANYQKMMDDLYQEAFNLENEISYKDVLQKSYTTRKIIGYIAQLDLLTNESTSSKFSYKAMEYLSPEIWCHNYFINLPEDIQKILINSNLQKNQSFKIYLDIDSDVNTHLIQLVIVQKKTSILLYEAVNDKTQSKLLNSILDDTILHCWDCTSEALELKKLDKNPLFVELQPRKLNETPVKKLSHEKMYPHFKKKTFINIWVSKIHMETEMTNLIGQQLTAVHHITDKNIAFKRFKHIYKLIFQEYIQLYSHGIISHNQKLNKGHIIINGLVPHQGRLKSTICNNALLVFKQHLIAINLPYLNIETLQRDIFNYIKLLQQKKQILLTPEPIRSDDDINDIDDAILDITQTDEYRGNDNNQMIISENVQIHPVAKYEYDYESIVVEIDTLLPINRNKLLVAITKIMNKTFDIIPTMEFIKQLKQIYTPCEGDIMTGEMDLSNVSREHINSTNSSYNHVDTFSLCLHLNETDLTRERAVALSNPKLAQRGKSYHFACKECDHGGFTIDTKRELVPYTCSTPINNYVMCNHIDYADIHTYLLLKSQNYTHITAISGVGRKLSFNRGIVSCNVCQKMISSL